MALDDVKKGKTLAAVLLYYTELSSYYAVVTPKARFNTTAQQLRFFPFFHIVLLKH